MYICMRLAKYIYPLFLMIALPKTAHSVIHIPYKKVYLILYKI